MIWMNWFKEWLSASKKHEPKIEDLEVKSPKHKPIPSPKTKTSEEIFKDFEWYGRPKHTNTSKGKIEVWERDPNLLKAYRIFSLDETASKEDIKSHYHDLAKKYHPDYNKFSHAAQSFINLNKWYEYLLKHHVQKGVK